MTITLDQNGAPRSLKVYDYYFNITINYIILFFINSMLFYLLIYNSN